MKLECSEKEKEEIFADLKSEYLYILLPFILLISVKGYLGSWKEILISSDWGLASCLIFGQITSKVSKAVSSIAAQAKPHNFGWYTTKRIAMVIISTIVYFGMLSKPSAGLGAFQIVLFLTASYYHFSDGFATNLIQKAAKK